MQHPKTKIKINKTITIIIHYKQTPYDGRYYLMNLQNEKEPIVKIKSCYYKDIFCNIVGGLGIHLESSFWKSFLNKVEIYNKYLNNTNN